nr:unnamed protein product [Digitaria exilis]
MAADLDVPDEVVALLGPQLSLSLSSSSCGGAAPHLPAAGAGARAATTISVISANPQQQTPPRERERERDHKICDWARRDWIVSARDEEDTALQQQLLQIPMLRSTVHHPPKDWAGKSSKLTKSRLAIDGHSRIRTLVGWFHHKKPCQVSYSSLRWLGCSQLDCCLWPFGWRAAAPSVRAAVDLLLLVPVLAVVRPHRSEGGLFVASRRRTSRPQRPPLRRSSWIQRGRALRHAPAHDGEQGSYLPLAHSSTPSTVFIPAALPDYAKKAEAAEKLAEVMLLFLVLSP